MVEVKALVYALATIAISVVLYFYNKRQLAFPIVNAYPNDYSLKKAHARYETEAKELISTGLAKHQGPFVLERPGGSVLILPASLSDWAKANKDLDHQELVKDDFLSDYPAFEAQTAIHHSDRLVINVIKTKLSKNEGVLPVLQANIAEALEQHWGDDQSWHAIDWHQDTTGIISRAAASVFAGPDLAKDYQWQEVTVKYVMDYFTAVVQLRHWPALLRPLAHRFNPSSRACQCGIDRIRLMLQEEAVRRDAAKALGAVYDDAIEWTTAAAGGRHVDHGAVQLGLAVAAIFTTSEALRQTVIELCRNTDAISAVREEVKRAIAESGWSMNAFFKMKLLDSVMKEGQRTLPALSKLIRTPQTLTTEKKKRMKEANLAPPVGLERKALRDTFLPDGTVIPAGTHIAVDSSLMWDANVHASPEKFDGRRFLTLRESTGNPTHIFTASSKEHNTFGMGRSMCPGRFFADVELKLCLAHMLLDYEFRLEEGYTSTPMYSGVYPVVDPVARVEVRRVRG